MPNDKMSNSKKCRKDKMLNGTNTEWTKCRMVKNVESKELYLKYYFLEKFLDTI